MGDQIAEVRALEAWNEPLTNIGFDRTECRMRLMSKASEECLHDSFFKVLPRVGSDDLFAQFFGEAIVSLAQDIQTNTRIEQRDFRFHVLRNAWSGVQRNGFPYRLDLRLGNVVRD